MVSDSEGTATAFDSGPVKASDIRLITSFSQSCPGVKAPGASCQAVCRPASPDPSLAQAGIKQDSTQGTAPPWSSLAPPPAHFPAGLSLEAAVRRPPTEDPDSFSSRSELSSHVNK